MTTDVHVQRQSVMSPEDLDAFLKSMAQRKCPCKLVLNTRAEEDATTKQTEATTNPMYDEDSVEKKRPTTSGPSHRLMLSFSMPRTTIKAGDDNSGENNQSSTEQSARLAQNQKENRKSQTQKGGDFDAFCLVCSDETVTRHEESIALEAARKRLANKASRTKPNRQPPQRTSCDETKNSTSNKSTAEPKVVLLEKAVPPEVVTPKAVPTRLANILVGESSEETITDTQKSYFSQLVKRRRLTSNQREKYHNGQNKQQQKQHPPVNTSRRQGRKRLSPEEQATKINRAQRLLTMRLDEQRRKQGSVPSELITFPPPKFSAAVSGGSEEHQRQPDAATSERKRLERECDERDFERDFENTIKEAMRAERSRHRQVPDSIGSSDPVRRPTAAELRAATEEDVAKLRLAALKGNTAHSSSDGQPSSKSPPTARTHVNAPKPPSAGQFQLPPSIVRTSDVDAAGSRRRLTLTPQQKVDVASTSSGAGRPAASDAHIPSRESDAGNSDRLPMSQAEVALAASAAAERVAATIGDGGDALMDRLQEAMSVPDLDARDRALQEVEDDMRREEEVLRELILAKKHARLKRRIEVMQSGYSRLAEHILDPAHTPVPDPPAPPPASEQPSFSELANQLLAKAQEEQRKEKQRQRDADLEQKRQKPRRRHSSYTHAPAPAPTNASTSRGADSFVQPHSELSATNGSKSKRRTFSSPALRMSPEVAAAVRASKKKRASAPPPPPRQHARKEYYERHPPSRNDSRSDGRRDESRGSGYRVGARAEDDPETPVKSIKQKRTSKTSTQHGQQERLAPRPSQIERHPSAEARHPPMEGHHASTNLGPPPHGGMHPPIHPPMPPPMPPPPPHHHGHHPHSAHPAYAHHYHPLPPPPPGWPGPHHPPPLHHGPPLPHPHHPAHMHIAASYNHRAPPPPHPHRKSSKSRHHHEHQKQSSRSSSNGTSKRRRVSLQ